MKFLTFFLQILLRILFAFSLLTGIAAIIIYSRLAPALPSTEALKEVRMQVPLRIYTRDGKLIGEYGEMKRTPLAYQDIPELMIKAVLAAEDDRFFTHPGVDYQSLLRAAVHLVRTREKGQGGSTITMQVARNFFLSAEKTYTRKLTEILLALKIDRELSKEEILELYLNKIFLGQRSYGVAVAAQTYYGKDIQDLSLAQYAMLAGLPKAPSTLNPVTNPDAAFNRRNYVLGRMFTLGYITREQYELAKDSAISASLHNTTMDIDASYVAEMARTWMFERHGDEAYATGYKVYTSVDARLQQAANSALRNNLLAYDRRHGYRGPEAQIESDQLATFDDWDRVLDSYKVIGQLYPALVIDVEEKSAIVYHPSLGMLLIEWQGLNWARKHISENNLGPVPKQAADVLQAGDIVRVRLHDNCQWQLSQIPAASATLLALRPQDGALQALTGGFDFSHSKFNRALQAERQPGSSFKPFIFAAALDKGYTPASVINDAPVVFDDDNLEKAWRPENYSGRFYGPTRLRIALTHSRNLVSVRLLRSIGITYTIDYLQRFGFQPEKMPRDLSLSLGSSSLTPLELTRGYAVFANGGFLVEPYFIDRVEDASGNPVFQANPLQACDTCETESPALTKDNQNVPVHPEEATDEELVTEWAPRVLDARTAYLVTNMMQDVIQQGTGRAARSLGRRELAGKTGTTNEQRDAWFAGYDRELAVTSWVGFDTPHPLGNQETGARAALPMWIDFMATALRDVPQHDWQQPEGLASVRIDAETGELATSTNPHAIFEILRSEDMEKMTQPAAGNGQASGRSVEEDISRELF